MNRNNLKFSQVLTAVGGSHQVKKNILATLAIFTINTQFAQTADSCLDDFTPPQIEPLLFTPGSFGEQISIPFDNSYRSGNAVINLITKGTWPQNALIALQKARDILAASVSSTQEINIDCYFTPLAGRLGEAGPVNYVNSNNIPAIAGEPPILPNTLYPVALANKLARKDFYPSASDITLKMNSNVGPLAPSDYGLNWYYGTDAKPVNVKGNAQVDFVTVALHEMLHGVGFLSFVRNDPPPMQYQLNGATLVYDNFVESVTATKLTSMPNTGTALNNLVVSDNVYFNSPTVLMLNNGERARLYAPTPYAPGSAISHLKYGYIS